MEIVTKSSQDTRYVIKVLVVVIPDAIQAHVTIVDLIDISSVY